MTLLCPGDIYYFAEYNEPYFIVTSTEEKVHNRVQGITLIDDTGVHTSFAFVNSNNKVIVGRLP